jgi:hypothetical protein
MRDVLWLHSIGWRNLLGPKLDESACKECNWLAVLAQFSQTMRRLVRGAGWSTTFVRRREILIHYGDAKAYFPLLMWTVHVCCKLQAGRHVECPMQTESFFFSPGTVVEWTCKYSASPKPPSCSAPRAAKQLRNMPHQIFVHATGLLDPSNFQHVTKLAQYHTLRNQKP